MMQRQWSQYAYFLSWAADYYNTDANDFVRTKKCGANIGHPEVDILWHALIDLWHQRKEKIIEEQTYLDCLNVLDHAYERVWREFCAQEQFDFE